MRPISAEFQTSQNFGDGATAGVVANPDPDSGMGYYVWLYGNYQPFGHAGWDGACPIGTPIYAPADGTVLYAGWTEDLPGTGDIRKWLMYYNFGGILTAIQHDGWISFIAHQSDNNMVRPGMRVKEGQLIGKSGNTKTRTTTVAPHVHVEALVYMDYRTDVSQGIVYGRVDPTQFFGAAAIGPQGTTTTPKEDTLSAAEVKVITDAIAEVKNIANNTHAGIWKGGAYNGKTYAYGALPIIVEMQRRQAVDNAQIKNLISALAAVAKGEAFDEAKLLAGVQAAAEAGVKAGMVDGTVTVDVNVAGGTNG